MNKSLVPVVYGSFSFSGVLTDTWPSLIVFLRLRTAMVRLVVVLPYHNKKMKMDDDDDDDDDSTKILLSLSIIIFLVHITLEYILICA